MSELRYIECKTGCSDNGPAWIAYVRINRTGKTIYFLDHVLQKSHGISGNFCDAETGEEYWISGVKKRGSNRHWAGRGKILIDRRAVPEFLALRGEPSLDVSQYTITDLPPSAE